MAAIATSAYLPPLVVPHERDGIGRELEAVLQELVALSLIGKQLQWAVFGPLFRSVRGQLDELVNSWRELADLVAERAVAFGFVPDGQAPAIVTKSQLTPVGRSATEDHVVVRELAHRVAYLAETVRERMDRIGDVDLVSQNILIDVVNALETHQWMLRTQLRGGAR